MQMQYMLKLYRKNIISKLLQYCKVYHEKNYKLQHTETTASTGTENLCTQTKTKAKY